MRRDKFWHRKRKRKSSSWEQKLHWRLLTNVLVKKKKRNEHEAFADSVSGVRCITQHSKQNPSPFSKQKIKEKNNKYNKESTVTTLLWCTIRPPKHWDFKRLYIQSVRIYKHQCMVFMCRAKDSDRCIQDTARFTKIVTGMYRQDSMLHRLLKCNPEVPPTTTEQKKRPFQTPYCSHRRIPFGRIQ